MTLLVPFAGDGRYTGAPVHHEGRCPRVSRLPGQSVSGKRTRPAAPGTGTQPAADSARNRHGSPELRGVRSESQQSQEKWMTPSVRVSCRQTNWSRHLTSGSRDWLCVVYDWQIRPQFEVCRSGVTYSFVTPNVRVFGAW